MKILSKYNKIYVCLNIGITICFSESLNNIYIQQLASGQLEVSLNHQNSRSVQLSVIKYMHLQPNILRIHTDTHSHIHAETHATTHAYYTHIHMYLYRYGVYIYFLSLSQSISLQLRDQLK